MSEQRSIAASDGTNLSLRLDGRAGSPLLLLLHSIGCDRNMWTPQRQELVDQFLVISLDLRGHGGSDAPEGGYTLTRLALDVADVLDALGAEQAHVCGLSLGGLVAQQLSLQAPARVRSLTLASTASRIGTPEAWRDRAALVLDQGMAAVAELALGRFFSDAFRAEAPAVVQGVLDALCATSPVGYAGCCAALRDGDLTSEVGAIAAKTLVVAGSRDVSTAPDQVRRLAAAIPGAGYVELDAAHLCNLEQPRAFTAAVRRLLEDG